MKKVSKVLECKLQSVIPRFKKVESPKPKYGTYLQTMHWGVKGFGKKTWVVAVKIDLDYGTAKDECINDDEIVKKCIAYLNAPQKSRYGKKRMRKPQYTFNPAPYSYKVVEEDNKTYISAKLVTSEQKNKNFWNTGPSVL